MLDSLEIAQHDSMMAARDSMMAVQTKEALASGDYSTAIETLLQKGIEMTMGFASRILLAVVAYFILRWIVRKLNKFVVRTLEKRDVDASLSTFLKSLTNIVLNFILIIVVIGILGIETSSFVALFASAGVAIGMALSGTLQNFAGGVMILLFRPFKVGDFLEAVGVTGTVKEIQIFNTLILTTDNKMVIVPNGNLSTSVVTNYSKEPRRRVDFEFGIAYGDDYDKAKATLIRIINENPQIIQNEAGCEPFIALSKLDASSVNIVVRVWCDPANYWDVFFKMNEDVYKVFTSEGINIPFPQMDVHVHQA